MRMMRGGEDDDEEAEDDEDDDEEEEGDDAKAPPFRLHAEDLITILVEAPPFVSMQKICSQFSLRHRHLSAFRRSAHNSC